MAGHLGARGERADFRIAACLVSALALSAVAPAITSTQGPATAPPAPSDLPQSQMASGKALFERYCIACHGPSGQGDGYTLLGRSPADLTSPSTADKSDEELLTTIHRGKTNMPSWSARLSPREQRDVLAYVRSLSR